MTVEAQFPGTIIAAVNVCLTNSLKSSALNTFFQIVHPKFYTLSLLGMSPCPTPTQVPMLSGLKFPGSSPARSGHDADVCVQDAGRSRTSYVARSTSHSRVPREALRRPMGDIIGLWIRMGPEMWRVGQTCPTSWMSFGILRTATR
jgi:hypothetical protein